MRPAATLLACVALIVGCGGDANGPQLDSEDSLAVALAREDIARFCVEEAEGTRTSSKPYGEMLDGVDELIRIYRKDPEALYETEDGDLTVRQALTDAANDLSTCGERGPTQTAKLERVLAE